MAEHLWDERLKTENRHAPQKFLPVRGAVHFLAWSLNGDQAVARAKIQQRVSGIFQFQMRVDTTSS